MEHIAIYGAAFDPPHLGHMDVVHQLLQQFDQVLLIPSARHAFGKQMSSYQKRLQMLQTIIAEQFPKHGNEYNRVTISTVEQQLLTADPGRKAVFSFDLLTVLQDEMPDAKLTLVIGPDNARPETWAKFYRNQDIEANFSRYIAQERVAARSTLCRQLIAENNFTELEQIVGPQLANWLKGQNLYR